MNCMINENLYTKLRKSVWSSLRPLHKQNSYLHDGQSCHIVLLNITTALRQLPNITTTLQCIRIIFKIFQFSSLYTTMELEYSDVVQFDGFAKSCGTC